MPFLLSDQPIDADALKRALHDPHAGACVTFEGWVRDHNDGRPVSALDYEAYAELAVSEGEKILAEARARFAVDRIDAVHRTGPLAIGAIAVWVGVSAAHRGPAFDACRHVIDELKARVPIWKKERYTDGRTTWVEGTPPPA